MEVIRTIYKVKITKVETVEKKDQSWNKVSDTGNKKDNGAVYGYIDCIGEEEVGTDILIQELEEIDIPAVIKSINNL